MAENNAPLLTAEMATQAHAMISQVHIPAGQAMQALMLLSAVAAIANGQAVVIHAPVETEAESKGKGK